MSGVSSLFGYGPLGGLVADAAQVKQRLDALTAQVASGTVSDTYAGLGGGASVSLDLRPQIAETKGWQQNIAQAGTRLSVTQDVLSQIGSIATDALSSITGAASVSAPGYAAMAAQARDALQQVAGLLDTQVGGEYVLAGADTANPPVPDPQAILSGPLVTAISGAVAGLAAAGPAATAAATLSAAMAAGNSPFSATIGGQPPSVQVGPGRSVSVGLVANQNGLGPSTGPSTTGSYVLDVIRALATIGSIDQAGSAPAADVRSLLTDTQTSLQGAIAGISNDSAMLGARQDGLEATGSTLSNMVDVLTKQVSAVEGVDMAATASEISTVQAQLQASYKLIAGLTSFSLAQYLTS